MPKKLVILFLILIFVGCFSYEIARGPTSTAKVEQADRLGILNTWTYVQLTETGDRLYVVRIKEKEGYLIAECLQENGRHTLDHETSVVWGKCSNTTLVSVLRSMVQIEPEAL